MKPPRSSSAASVRIDVGQERGPAAVRFELGGRAERVAAVRLDVTHALGVATGMVPPASGGVTLDLRALPAGPTELRMTPVLTNGRDGRSVATGFGVPGRPGEAPEIASFRRATGRCASPARARRSCPGSASPSGSRGRRRAPSTSS